MIFIYPLKTMYSSALAWFTGGYLPSEIDLDSHADLAMLFTIFALAYIAMSAVIVLHYWHAWRSRDRLRLNEREVFITRSMMGTWSILASPGLLSLVLANTLEGMWIISAGFVYALLGVVMPIWEIQVYKRLERLPS
jgi:low temperature requirement protein LtrA